MKLCFIGASGHYNYVLGALVGEKDVQVTGIAPGTPDEKMEELSDKLCQSGYSPVYFEDYREMLDRQNPDVVVVNCYFGHHAAVAAQALARYKHVFVEKPVAVTLEELKDLKAVHGKAGTHFAAMLGMRYEPHFYTAWQTVKAGGIGKVRMMHAQKSYKLGTRGELYRNRKLYGGTIPWVGSHAIDWLHWFSGERFLSVDARHSTFSNQGHGELEATAVCQFELTHEVYATVNIDYLRPSTACGHSDDRLRVVGTEGIIEVRDNKAYIINTETEGVKELELKPVTGIFSDFLKQIKGEGTGLLSADDSFYTTEASLRARISADEKRKVLFYYE